MNFPTFDEPEYLYLTEIVALGAKTEETVSPQHGRPND